MVYRQKRHKQEVQTDRQEVDRQKRDKQEMQTDRQEGRQARGGKIDTNRYGRGGQKDRQTGRQADW